MCVCVLVGVLRVCAIELPFIFNNRSLHFGPHLSMLNRLPQETKLEKAFQFPTGHLYSKLEMP